MLILIFLSCNFKAQSPSNCFMDKGIKTAKIDATLLSDKTQTETATTHFNEYGKPTLRELNGRRIEFKYDLENLTHTLITQNDGEFGFSKTDTNVVAEYDELGRPIKIIGEDGGHTEYIYNNCDEQTEIFKDSDGELIHTFKSIFDDGILVETIWIPASDAPARTTKYFDYKFDDHGYWIERKYEYSSGKLIRETRKLEYY